LHFYYLNVIVITSDKLIYRNNKHEKYNAIIKETIKIYQYDKTSSVDRKQVS